MARAVRAHKSLTIPDVCDLGSALLEIADLYPLQLRTEKDFFPLVLGYLHGRVPSVTTEVASKRGRVDFRVGGTNPAVIELAVAPRVLQDKNHVTQVFRGHKVGTQLYASQNTPELEKLSGIPQTQAKNRYLLLLDLSGTHKKKTLKRGYLEKRPRFGGGAAIRVVYVRRGQKPLHFVVGGAKRAPD